MKILITGGVGFIGANFIYYMLDKYEGKRDKDGRPYRFVCVDALTYAENLKTLAPITDGSIHYTSKFTFYK